MKVQSLAPTLSPMAFLWMGHTCCAARPLFITWKSTNTFFELDEISTFYIFFFLSWFVSPPRSLGPVDWAFLILAVKKPFKVEKRSKMKRVNHFISKLSDDDACVWLARASKNNELARVHCIIPVWADDGNQADFCRLHSLRNEPKHVEALYIVFFYFIFCWAIAFCEFWVLGTDRTSSARQ